MLPVLARKSCGRSAIAFGAGALAALLLPRLMLTLVGAALLLAAGAALSKNQHKEC